MLNVASKSKNTIVNVLTSLLFDILDALRFCNYRRKLCLHHNFTFLGFFNFLGAKNFLDSYGPGLRV